MRIKDLFSRSPASESQSPETRRWLIRYGFALVVYLATIGLSLTLSYFSIRINLTIPVVLALVAAAWFGGRGAGLTVAVLFEVTTLVYNPIPANSTIWQAVIFHLSVFALYVFLVLLISGLNKIQQELRLERDRLRQSERTSERRNQELSTLYQFADTIQHSRSMDKVYEAALDAMFSALKCDRASILLFDSSGTMRFVCSRGLSEVYRHAVEGHSPWQPGEKDPKAFGIDDPSSAADLGEQLRLAIENEGISSLGFIPLISDDRLIGKMMVYYDQLHELTDAEFEMARTVGKQIAADVELKRIQTELLEYGDRLQLVTATGKVGVWDWYVREDRIEWSDAVYEIHGVTYEYALDLDSFVGLVHPEDRDRVRERITESLAGEVPYDVQLRIVRPDGSIRTLFTNGVVINDVDGPVRMIGATVDITDRLNLEEARRESEMMQRLVEAQEAERRRIARDLHDHLGQRMTALRLQIEALSKDHENGSNILPTLHEVKRASMQIDRDISFLSWELRPTELEDLGLEDALSTFVREWSQQYRIAAEFHATVGDRNGSGRLPDAVETNLYRIVQEALNNVLKHADATAVNVLLQVGKNELVLVVEDDGCGFERRNDNVNGNALRSLGLIGMQERAAVMKGVLEIESTNGKGTAVVARIPVI